MFCGTYYIEINTLHLPWQPRYHPETPNINKLRGRWHRKKVTCTTCTVMDYLHETPLIWVIILGCNITASLLLIATHMQSYHIHTKYIINIYLPTCVNVFLTLLKVDNMCGVK